MVIKHQNTTYYCYRTNSAALWNQWYLNDENWTKIWGKKSETFRLSKTILNTTLMCKIDNRKLVTFIILFCVLRPIATSVKLFADLKLDITINLFSNLHFIFLYTAKRSGEKWKVSFLSAFNIASSYGKEIHWLRYTYTFFYSYIFKKKSRMSLWYQLCLSNEKITNNYHGKSRNVSYNKQHIHSSDRIWHRDYSQGWRIKF